MYGLLGVTPFNTPLSLGLVDRLLGVLVAGVSRRPMRLAFTGSCRAMRAVAPLQR